jgi:ABC-type amino acid transport substrate-binding protein
MLCNTSIVALGCTLNLLLGTAFAGSMDDIKARGELVVGVKTDYPPYGFRDRDGRIVGLEPDLAADLAKRLGVSLKLVAVLSSNRIEFSAERQDRSDYCDLERYRRAPEGSGIYRSPLLLYGSGVIPGPF